MQLAADPGHSMAGLGALWAEAGGGGVGCEGFSSFFPLRKLPPFQQHRTQRCVTIAHPRTALMLWAAAQTPERGGGRSLTPRLVVAG